MQQIQLIFAFISSFKDLSNDILLVEIGWGEVCQKLTKAPKLPQNGENFALQHEFYADFSEIPHERPKSLCSSLKSYVFGSCSAQERALQPASKPQTSRKDGQVASWEFYENIEI